MPIESANYISNLNSSNPLSSDQQSQGDDHLRLIKQVLQLTFPNANKPFRFPDMMAEQSAAVVLTVADDGKVIPVSASGAARTVTLPTTSLTSGITFYVIKTDSSVNSVTISNGTINGASSLVLRHQWDAVELRYSAADSEWYAFYDTRKFITPVALSGNLTIDITHHQALIEVSAAGGTRTLTLPSGLPAGFWFEVSKTDLNNNAVTLDATSGGNINGSATFSFRAQSERRKVIWNGTTWSVPVEDGVPPGSTFMWWTETAPAGYAILNGQAISRTTYPRLFALYGTSYGIGDGSTTFNLPNPSGRFPRAWAQGSAQDPDAALRTAPAGSTISAGDHVGTEQQNQNKAHTHDFEYLNAARDPGASGGLMNYTGTGLSSPTTSEGGSDARPNNFAIAFIVKLG